jgi:periplasmic protein CpxP/Spy
MHGVSRLSSAQAYESLKKIPAAVNGTRCLPFFNLPAFGMPHSRNLETRMNTFASRFALLALAVSAVTLAPAAFAQDSTAAGTSSSQPANPQHAAPDPQKQAARLTKRLGLSADQSGKITTILQNQQQQLAAARGDNSLSKQDLHAKLRSIHQDTDTQITAVLTPAQQTQYANMKEQMKQRMQNAHNGGSSSGSSGNSSSNSGSNSSDSN